MLEVRLHPEASRDLAHLCLLSWDPATTLGISLDFFAGG